MDLPAENTLRRLTAIYEWGANNGDRKKMADWVDRLKWNELTKNFYSPLKIIAAERGFGARREEIF